MMIADHEWFLETDEARFLKKKIGGSNLDLNWPKLGFLLFSQVWFISFPLNYLGW